MIIPILLAALPLQSGGQPVTGPNGGSLEALDTSSLFGVTSVLAVESMGDGGRNHFVYEVGANGGLVLASQVAPSPTLSDALAFEGERLVGRDEAGGVRVYESQSGGWSDGVLLRQEPVVDAFASPLIADIDQGIAVLAAGRRSLITVDNIRVPGFASREASFGLSRDRQALALAMHGDTIAAVIGRPDGHHSVMDVEVLIYERLPNGWDAGSSLPAPTGVDWSSSELEVDVTFGRVAVSMSKGPGADPCGRVYVYEQTLAGPYVLESEIRSRRQCNIAPGIGAPMGEVTLEGNDLVVASGLDGAAERFSRVAGGWQEEELVRLEGGAIRTKYHFVQGFLLGTSSIGVQVLGRDDTRAGVEIVCPALSPVAQSLLTSSQPSTFLPTPITLEWSIDLAFAQQAFLVAGVESGLRPLGPEAQLCVGGPVRLFPVSVSPSSVGGTAYFPLDPTAAAITPGTSVFFQGWRREPGLPMGRTSNAVAVTFAP